jgi:hypothetical protein
MWEVVILTAFAFASDIHGVPTVLMPFAIKFRFLNGYRLLNVDRAA